MQFKDGAYASVAGQYGTNSSIASNSNTRNLIRARMGSEQNQNGQNSLSVSGQQPPNHFNPNSMDPQQAQIANDFMQKQMQLGMMGSPRQASLVNPNNIFEADQVGGHSRIYSYHFIYEYLFVQVSELQFMKDYQGRIRVRKHF